MKSFRIIALFIVVILLLSCSGCKTMDSSNNGNAVYEKLTPSTVEVIGEGINFTSMGSGFYIDDNGTVVTNFHVIENCKTISIKTYDGGTYSVESVLGYDKNNDLAILSTSKKNSVAVKLRREAAVTGETVYALGSSLSLQGTFSEGIVSSAVREIDGISFIQTTVPISNGNSGGPLADSKGEVVGITTASLDGGQNLNLAIPVSAISNIATNSPLSVEDFYYESAERVLVVAMDADFYPFCFEENGEFRGVHVDIANELASRMGWVAKCSIMSFEELFIAINSDACDIVLGVEETPTRAEFYTFTDSYYNGMSAIINTSSFDFEEYSKIKKIFNGMISDGTIDQITGNYNIESDYYDSPMNPATINLPDLPRTIKHNWSYGVWSEARIDHITYTVNDEMLYIYFTGEKTYDYSGATGTNMCVIGWKLYDTEGYLIDSGSVYTGNLSVGDKFKDQEAYSLNKIKPDQEYNLVLVDTN